jgi:glycosyltransferase involved in cell wall biosynthesis
VPNEGSVIVRARNEEASIERCLRSLRGQTGVSLEIILVDSGSTDATVARARPFVDRVIEIPAAAFTFGHALNVGAEAAGAPIHFALSAHCVLHRDDWAARSLTHYAGADVCATSGASVAPDGTPLRGPLACRSPEALDWRYWGFTNHASSWRGEVWRRFPFDERIDACEDREWSYRVMRAGYILIADPELWVSAEHRFSSGLRALFDRTRREARALAILADGGPYYSVRDALTEITRPDPRTGRLSPRELLRVARYAQAAGRLTGEQEVRVRRAGHAGVQWPAS